MRIILAVLVLVTSNLASAAVVKIDQRACEVIGTQTSVDFKRLTVLCKEGAMATVQTSGLLETKALSDILMSTDSKTSVNLFYKNDQLEANAQISFSK